VPPGFDRWWQRAAERDLARRFASAREMVDALAEAFGLASPDAPHPSAHGAPSAPGAGSFAGHAFPAGTPGFGPPAAGPFAPAPSPPEPHAGPAPTGRRVLAATIDDPVLALMSSTGPTSLGRPQASVSHKRHVWLWIAGASLVAAGGAIAMWSGMLRAASTADADAAASRAAPAGSSAAPGPTKGSAEVPTSALAPEARPAAGSAVDPAPTDGGAPMASTAQSASAAQTRTTAGGKERPPVKGVGTTPQIPPTGSPDEIGF
jgi:serine/threonine-protein kinase